MEQINVVVLMLSHLDRQKGISNLYGWNRENQTTIHRKYGKFEKKKKNEYENSSARDSYGYFVFQIDKLT